MAAAVPLGISALGAMGQRGAAQEAAGAQEQAAREALAFQMQQLGITLKGQRPFWEAGRRALTQQEALLGTLGPEEQQAAFQAFTESPGQAFLRERGEQAVLRNAAALGGLGGGNVLTALQQQGIGFAQQDLQNQLQNLLRMSEAGRGAAGTVGQIGSQAASNVGTLLVQAGQAQATGILGGQQATQQLLGMAGGAATGGLAGAGYFGAPAQTAFGGTAGSGALLGML